MKQMADQVRSIIDSVQIENVRLIESAAMTSLQREDPQLPPQLDVATNARFVRLGRPGTFFLTVSFRISPPTEAREELSPNVLHMQCTFELEYSIPEDLAPTESDLNGFARINGLFNAWPYAREFIQSTLARMGLPALTLPVFRLSDLAQPDPETSEALIQPSD